MDRPQSGIGWILASTASSLQSIESGCVMRAGIKHALGTADREPHAGLTFSLKM